MKQFNYLSSLPQPEQKSQEWYDARDNKITASSIATAIGEIPYPNQTPYDLLLEKCGKGPGFNENKFVHHGKKYEQIATMIYEHIYNAKVSEFGLLPHPTINFLGASPDGICNQYTLDNKFSKRLGTMLEIKCPLTRKIKTKGDIDGEICPHYYWCQVQVQLECCDLDDCDFWQCELVEYKNREKWLQDKCEDTKNTEEQNNPKYIPKYACKGCIIQFIHKNDWNNYDADTQNYRLWGAKYIYPKTLNMTCQEYEEWIMKIINDPSNYDPELTKDYIYDKVIYWKLKKSHNVQITRDREWFQKTLPKLSELWDKVIYYRQHLNELDEYVTKMKKDFKPNYPKKTFIKKSNDNDLFLSDSAESIDFIDSSTESDELIIPSNDHEDFDDQENDECDII